MDLKGTDVTTYMLIFASALNRGGGRNAGGAAAGVAAGVIDQPSARKVHVTPMPLLGGLAIYAAFVAALLLFGNRYGLTELISILVGASLMSFLGVWDDRRTLSPWLKLIGQFLLPRSWP